MDRNTLVKWKAFVSSVGIKGADLEDEFLFQILGVSSIYESMNQWVNELVQLP